jgi:hypothetical protein
MFQRIILENMRVGQERVDVVVERIGEEIRAETSRREREPAPVA